MSALDEYERLKASDAFVNWKCADAAIESLKCCGNCGVLHTYNAGTDDEFRECPYIREDEPDHDYMDIGCAYDPSRWQERQP